jgi:hypothetical protein
MIMSHNRWVGCVWGVGVEVWSEVPDHALGATRVHGGAPSW